MKTYILKFFVLVLRVIYAPIKLSITRDKIVFLSRQSDEKSRDMELLEQKIKEISPETEVVFSCKKFKNDSGFSVSYIFRIITDLFRIASARVVVCDTYSIPVSCLKHKKDLRVVQMWHASGAIKKFGMQSVGKPDGTDAVTADVLKMHCNYDYILAPSEATAAIYKEAFNSEKAEYIIGSLPHIDDLMAEGDRSELFLTKNYDYIGRKIVLYLPTFRENDYLYASRLEKAFKDSEKYRLLVSAHPLSASYKRNFSGNFSTTDLMKIADVIITDYSACAFEAAAAGKKLLFYVPDYEEYSVDRGLNIELKKEIGDFVFENETKLFDFLENGEYDMNKLIAFSDKYVKYKNTDNTSAFARFLCGIADEKE